MVERTLPDAVSIAAIGRVLELVGDGAATWAEDGRGRRLPLSGGDPGTGAHGVSGGSGAAGLSRAWRSWTAAATALDDPGLPATGQVALGGFAFRPERTPAGAWAGFPAALLRVPQLAVVRSAGRCFSVASMLARPGESTGDVGRRLARLGRLLRLAGPGADADPPAKIRAVPGPGERARWEDAVTGAVTELRAGRLQKVVLARALLARADRPVHLARVLAALRAAYPAGHTFAVGGADGTCLVGSSPELLVDRRGDRLVSQPLAGSTGRAPTAGGDRRLALALRGDPKEQAEHRVVVEDIVERLAPYASRIEVGAAPTVLRLPTIQHLATTIRARLTGTPLPSALDVAAALHPTAAVGGSPRHAALRLQGELEGLERGWYTGAIGWVDGRGDGELALALRCGLLWQEGALCFAGAGIMPGSDPAREWAETELKLMPLLRALAS
ncbi:MAG TPA: isochorismate synthase [Candidatus Micrarchaeia archaeon]|nr:isochorismate synthase [Candidatus Micrarchaeia archaeon]